MGFELEKRIAAEARQRLLEEERRRAEHQREVAPRTGKLSGIMGRAHDASDAHDPQLESFPVAGVPWPTSQRSTFDDFRIAGLRDVMLELAASRKHHDLLPSTIAATDPSLISRPEITVTNAPAGQAMWRVAERRAASLYRRAVDTGEVAADDPIVEEALARCGGGHALPTELKRKMEDELGVSLHRVRVHTDSVAADAARAVRAEAFTVGEDIFFAENAFAPDTRAGQKLLAHELAHVVQAWQGRAAAHGSGVRVSEANESLELEADAIAERIDQRVTRPTAKPVPVEHASPRPTSSRYTASSAPAIADLEARKRLAAPGNAPSADRNFTRLMRKAAAANGPAGDHAHQPHTPGQPTIHLRRDHATEHAHKAAAHAHDKSAGAVKNLTQQVGAATKASLDHVDQGVQHVAAMGVGNKAEEHGKNDRALHDQHRHHALERAKQHAGHHHAPPHAGAHAAHHGEKVDAHGPIHFKPISDWAKYMPAPLPDEDERERHRILKLVKHRVEGDRNEAKRDLNQLRKRQLADAAAVRKLGPGLQAGIAAAQGQALATVSSAEASQTAAVYGAVAAVQAQVRAHAAAMKSQVTAAHATAVQQITAATTAANHKLTASHQRADTDIDAAMNAQLAVVRMLFTSTKLKVIALGGQKAGEAAGLGNSISLPYHGDKLHAAQKAARQVAGEYASAMPKEAADACNQIGAEQPKTEADVRKIAADQKKTARELFTKAKKAVKTAHDQAIKAAETVKQQATTQLDQISGTTCAQLTALGASRVAAIRGQAANARAGITSSGQAAQASMASSVAQAATGIEKGALGLIQGARDIEAPNPEETKKVVRQSERALSGGSREVVTGLKASATASAGALRKQAAGAAAGMAATAGAAAAAAQQMGAGANHALTQVAQGATQSLEKITQGHHKQVDETTKAADEGFKELVSSTKKAYQTATQQLKTGLDGAVHSVTDSFNKAVPAKETEDILKNAKKAADAVKPWWKKALAFVVSVVVAVVVVVVITALVVTTGPVGAILVGAAAGALASVAGQMASNLVLGNGLTDGITWQSVAIGAIAGGAAAGLSAGIEAGAGQMAGSAGTIGTIGKTVSTALEGGGGLGGYGIRVGESVLTERTSDAAAQLIVNGKYEFSVKDLVISLGVGAIASTGKFDAISESAGGKVREALGLPPAEVHASELVGDPGATQGATAGAHAGSASAGVHEPAGTGTSAAHGGGDTAGAHGGGDTAGAHGGGDTAGAHGGDAGGAHDGAGGSSGTAGGQPDSSAHAKDPAQTSGASGGPATDQHAGPQHGANDKGGTPQGGSAAHNDQHAGTADKPSGGAHDDGAPSHGAGDKGGGAPGGAHDDQHASGAASHGDKAGGAPGGAHDEHAGATASPGKGGADHAGGTTAHNDQHASGGADPGSAPHAGKAADSHDTGSGGGEAPAEAETAALDTELKDLGYPQGTTAKKEEVAATVGSGATPTKDQLRDTAANEQGRKDLEAINQDPNLTPEQKAKVHQQVAQNVRGQSEPTGNLARDVKQARRQALVDAAGNVVLAAGAGAVGALVVNGPSPAEEHKEDKPEIEIDPPVIGPVQRKANGGAMREGGDPAGVAARGVAGGGGALPHLATIQKSFGHHDVSNVSAHTGGAAATASRELDASAYATGNSVAFADAPDLHTAAHEAAHVVQQRGGVQLKGGIDGGGSDPYEQHADAVADAVVAGKSAESLLDHSAGGGGGPAVQRDQGHGGPSHGGGAARRGGAGSRPQLTVQLHQVGGGGGAAPAPAAGAPRMGGAGGAVAPVEYISASGYGHVTSSIMMDRIVQMMRRDRTLTFVNAARQIAAQRRIGDEPVNSSQVGASSITDDAPVRYALVIGEAAYDGHDWPVLEDVADHTRAGSPTIRAVERDYGHGNTEVVHNETVDQMRAAIHGAIDTVAGRLHPGQQGELMVNFQGHGTANGIAGVDGHLLTAGDLTDLSTYAVEHRVHIEVVSDGCFGGRMTLAAQVLANQHLSARVDQAAARHELTTADAATLRTQLAELQRDLMFAGRISSHLEALGLRLAEVHVTEAAIADQVNEIRDWLRNYGPEIAGGLPMLSGQLNQQIHDVWNDIVVNHAPIRRPEEIRRWRDRIDHLAGSINGEVNSAQEGIALVLDLQGPP